MLKHVSRRSSSGAWLAATRMGVAVGILALGMSLSSCDGKESDSSGDAPGNAALLATVNGEAVTVADLDAMVMQRHQQTDLRKTTGADMRRLLDRAINDRLLLQQALSMGMEEEPAVRDEIDTSRRQRAVRIFVTKSFQPSMTADPNAVQEYFQEYYHKLEYRQITVRTKAEAQQLREQILGGASMGALALELSLDTQRFKEGLHELLPWVDVENPIREQVPGLKLNEISEPFAYREAFALVRVEKREAPNPAEFDELKPAIERAVLQKARETSWARFLETLEMQTPVDVDPDVIATIREDEGILFRAEFLKDAPTPAMSIGEDVITEGDLRRAVSHAAMVKGMGGFDAFIDAGIAEKKEELLLRHHAIRGGFLDDPQVEAAAQEELRQTLIEAYLAEAILPQISFRRDEFDAYYDEHPEEFRDLPEVRLAMILVEAEADAKSIASRLAEGADFEFVRKQYASGHADASADAKWSPIEIFSSTLKEEIERLEVGQSSQALQIPTGWIVFKVEGKREGRIKPIEEVEMQIREVMFQKQFDAALDEHLKLLEERSEVVRNQDVIERYFGDEGADE